ncbi:MAG: DUF1080 domain-containing protein [Planctomycetota bacterium]
MRTTIVFLIALLMSLACPPCAHAADPDWQDLFNGSDLTGWIPTGNADAWTVEDGEIRITDAGGGKWLRTDRTFRDFELELDFYIPEDSTPDNPANSGVGLRGFATGDPAFSGFEVQILGTHGQDPNLRNCGAVYEAIEPTTMAVNPAGEWNNYRIRVRGDTLNVWLNGTRIHRNQKLDDRGFFRDPSQPLPLNARATTGYIALQDHGSQVRFRNIRIKDYSPNPEPAGMTPLAVDDLDGWFLRNAGEWTASDGEIVGRGGPGHLFTDEQFGDFELRTLVKVNERGNSGIYFRCKPNPGAPWPLGNDPDRPNSFDVGFHYEAQVDNHDPKNFTGVLYNCAYSEDITEPITRDDAWFDYRIVADGRRLQTWINGVLVVDAVDSRFARGHIALQGHHPGNEIRFRDMRILRLDETESRP